jgi:ribosomal protein S18 acetylase RimI-like enzyme
VPPRDEAVPVTSAISDGALRRRQAASQRAFYRMLGSASRDARLLQFAGVQATIVPVRPWFSVFNSVLYEDAQALQAALPILAEEYERAGVGAWTVWVPPGDRAAKSVVESAGHLCDSTPLLMAAPISAIDLRGGIESEPLEPASWTEVARCNDRAHGVLEPWSMAAVFEHAQDPDSHLYAARRQGSIASALIAREHDGDCYFWFVATSPEAQRQGLASELMRHALRQARGRGCDTTTLESTKAGESVYSRLGYAPLGRFEMWERRAS